MIQHCVIIGHIIGGNAEDLYCVDEYVFSIFDFSLSYPEFQMLSRLQQRLLPNFRHCVTWELQ